MEYSGNDEPREIDSVASLGRYARGWHCLGLSEPYKDGEPHAIHAFGTKLVVFADSRGELAVLE
ncbi:3-ketosteroid-9-alpha-hydroxylase, partial [Rhodococcus sp. H29-C3]|nr:3-ketosteroid-9-alpha-hydroxylase [Rhodococcus sp. H29-C3]